MFPLIELTGRQTAEILGRAGRFPDVDEQLSSRRQVSGPSEPTCVTYEQHKLEKSAMEYVVHIPASMYM
jgi:hypothetical protein